MIGATPLSTVVAQAAGAIQASGGNASAAVSASAAGGMLRSLAARTGDTFLPQDYGALGTGSAATVGTTYGTTLAALAAYTASNGAHPFAWATNPYFGLTFSMSTTAAQSAAGTGLTFLSSAAGINGGANSAASWQYQQNGADVLQPGMVVSGSCIPTGDTVSLFNNVTGVITLASATSSACARGTTITFTASAAQIEALTYDWLGIEAALYAAWDAGGGKVRVKAGNYKIGWPISVPPITNVNTTTPAMILEGDGRTFTNLIFTHDFGTGSCGLGDALRYAANNDAVYEGFSLNDSFATGNQHGTMVAGMDGLCIGRADKVYSVSVAAVHAGINAVGDHWTIQDSDLNNNFYGLYMAPNSSTYGNEYLLRDGFIGNAYSGLAVAWNNSLTSSEVKNSHFGNEPYGFYREPMPSGVTTTESGMGFVTQSTLEDDYGESLGNSFIYGPGANDSFQDNTVIATDPEVSGGGAYQIPGAGIRGIIAVASIFGNHFYNSDFATGNAGAAALFAATNSVQSNSFDEMTNAILNSSVPILAAPTVIFNTFEMDRAAGEFRRAETAVTTGQVVEFGTTTGANGGTRPLVAGGVALGIATQSQPAGTIVPVVERGWAAASKTVDVAIPAGAPVCASTTIPSSVTVCANKSGGPIVGVQQDGGTEAASATTSNIAVRSY